MSSGAKKGPVSPAGMSHPAHQQSDSWRRMACRLLSGTDLQEQKRHFTSGSHHLRLFLWIESVVGICYVFYPNVMMWGCVCVQMGTMLCFSAMIPFLDSTNMPLEGTHFWCASMHIQGFGKFWVCMIHILLSEDGLDCERVIWYWLSIHSTFL